MIGRKSVLGVAVLCALVFGAFAAANASAEQRAYSCSEGGAQFTDAHCLSAGSGPYGHVLLEGETAITGTNANTAEGTSAAAVSKLLGALSGVVTELQCTGLSGTGQLTNAASSVSGTGVITYEGCSVTKPANKGCKVAGNKVVTETLNGTTVGQAANKLKFTPSGETFAKITIEGCSIGALNNTFPVTGSLVADTSGATTTTTHAGITSQGTLKFGGVKAGLEGALTIKAGGDGVALT
ncbi:MAG: hypothetical protein AB7V58_07940 [Solirubrobacterales bacterium]